ncbi:hypothetical protein D9611_013433 [Ephemerocybe angulata]|uniref:Uncharacterized protein n=1 Tax=Ephemerocybe angulata TaxID=980116 RepID=A0A8H5BUM4_9AGAR|nr:hypothetical protein D9611_013433 [Tulosesus angulatus]
MSPLSNGTYTISAHGDSGSLVGLSGENVVLGESATRWTIQKRGEGFTITTDGKSVTTAGDNLRAVPGAETQWRIERQAHQGEDSFTRRG